MLKSLFQRIRKYYNEHLQIPWEDKTKLDKVIDLIIFTIKYLILRAILKPILEGKSLVEMIIITAVIIAAILAVHILCTKLLKRR